MALYKYHYITLDTKRTPRISLQNIVAGETGNMLVITLTNNESTVNLAEKSNGEFIYRICLRVDSNLGVRRQDSAMENSGITLVESGANAGKAEILLSKDSFTSGMNHAWLEIFSTGTETNDTLICSALFTFRATENSTGENAGSVYPSLIQAEEEAREATTAANTAATAANNAASSATSAASSANTAASNANNAADAANLAAGTLNALLENIDEEPTQFSDNLVTSGGVFQFVSDSVQYATDEVRDQIPLGASVKPLMDGTAAIGNSYKYARQDHVHPSDTSKQDILTFDNAPTTGSNNPVKSGGIKAAIDAVGTRVTALEGDGPIVLHVASVTESNGRKFITFEDGEADIIYANAFTRDMEFEMPAQITSQTVTNASIRMRKNNAKKDTNNVTQVAFSACIFGSALNIGYAVAGVYFTGDTFYSATYDEGEVTLS